MSDASLELPYEGAKEMLLVDDIYMVLLIYLKGKTCERGDALEITYKTNKIKKVCTDAKFSDRPMEMRYK